MNDKLPIKYELPGDFLEDEIRCGYNISNEMKKVWAVEIDLLVELLRVCKKYNIRIFADGGTILGAVRHNGYIPWDDDIDMMLMRGDYDRLCKIANTEFHPPYFFQTEYSDPGSMRGHAQLRNSETTGILKSELYDKYEFNQGIFIDIFPLDSAPDSDCELESIQNNTSRYLNWARKTSRITTRYVNKSNGIKNTIKRIIHSFLDMTGICKMTNPYYFMYERECKKYNDKTTRRVAKFFDVTPNKRKQVWERDWFDDCIECKFECIEIPLPQGYKALLDSFFGNWRELVKVDNSHGGVIFDTNKSYKDFIQDI